MAEPKLSMVEHLDAAMRFQKKADTFRALLSDALDEELKHEVQKRVDDNDLAARLCRAVAYGDHSIPRTDDEAEGWLFKCERAGKRMTYVSIDKNDRGWEESCGMQSWRSVSRQALFTAPTSPPVMVKWTEPVSQDAETQAQVAVVTQRRLNWPFIG